MPCSVKLYLEEPSIKQRELQRVELQIHLFEFFYRIGKLYHVLYPIQFLFIIVSQGLLFHPSLFLEFGPVINKFKIIHHHENFLNDLVMDPPHGGNLLIQELVPIQLLGDDNPYSGFIEVKELGQLLMGKFGAKGRFCFGQRHQPAIPEQVQGLLRLKGPGHVRNWLQGLFRRLTGDNPAKRRMPHNDKNDFLEFIVAEPKKGQGLQVFK